MSLWYSYYSLGSPTNWCTYERGFDV